MEGNVLSVERIIPAPPEAIFALVADAARHPEIDGSGTVVAAKSGNPEHLAMGSKFGMGMKQGFKYNMVSTVIEFEQDRRIAWQSVPPGIPGKVVGGRIWRYVLEPVEGGTKVTESWDISQDKQRSLLKLGGMPEKAKTSMEKTLARIEELTTAP